MNRRRLWTPVAALVLAAACGSCVLTNAVTFDEYRPGGMRPDATFVGALLGGFIPGVGQFMSGEYVEGAVYLGLAAGEIILLTQVANSDVGVEVVMGAVAATWIWSFVDSVGSYIGRSSSYNLFDSQFRAIPTSVKLEPRDFPTIHPALATSYGIEPVGELVITNGAPWALEDFVVDIEFPGIMSAPHRLESPGSLGVGQSVRIAPTLVLSGAALKRTEAGRIVGRITARYRVFDTKFESSAEIPAVVSAAGEIDLADAKRIAAFVTPNNASVRQFARAVAQAVTPDRNRALNAAFESAGALYAALQSAGFLSGIERVVWKGTVSAPWVHFPHETLAAPSGTALDLAVLYAALLESVGVSTAISVGSSDVVVLADTGVAFRDRSAVDTRDGQLVESGGTTWIPVLFRPAGSSPGDFCQAWDAGARSFSPDRPLVGTRSAWERYRPTADLDTAGAAPPVDSAKARAAYLAARSAYVDSRVAQEVKALEEKLAGRDSSATRNRIVVAYARFGRYAEAVEAADRAIALYPGNLSLLTNKANALALAGRAAESAEIVQALLVDQRVKTTPEQQFDLLVLLAKLRFETREYDKAAESFRTAARLDPKRAAPLGYLASAPSLQASGSARASSAASGFEPQWGSEESDNAN